MTGPSANIDLTDPDGWKRTKELKGWHTVYIYYRGDDQLYIGRSSSLHERTRVHRRSSWWFKEADSMRVRTFTTKEESVHTEARLVLNHGPGLANRVVPSGC